MSNPILVIYHQHNDGLNLAKSSADEYSLIHSKWAPKFIGERDSSPTYLKPYTATLLPEASHSTQYIQFSQMPISGFWLHTYVRACMYKRTYVNTHVPNFVQNCTSAPS